MCIVLFMRYTLQRYVVLCGFLASAVRFPGYSYNYTRAARVYDETYYSAAHQRLYVLDIRMRQQPYVVDHVR